VSAGERRLLAALRLLCVILVALHLLAPLLAEDRAWGVWPYAELPPLWLACVPWVANIRFRACGERRRALIHRFQRRKAPVCLLVALACAPLFWFGRIVHTRWGDAYILVNAIPHPEAQLTYTWQAPLDVFLHAKVWALGHSLLGWQDAMPAYWILSSIAGVGFVFVLCGLAGALGRDRVEKTLIFGLIASLGTMQLLFGYIESYTFICVGILAYLWLGLRALRGETDLVWAATILALTHAFHPSTLVLQPSLWYLAWRLHREGKIPVLESLLRVVVPSLVVGVGVLTMMEMGGHGLAALLGEDFPGGGDHRWLVPLLRTTTRWEHYTMFSWDHLSDLVNQQLLTAPVMLPTLLLTWLSARRRMDWRDQALRFLLLAAGCYLFLTFVWNPDYGGRRDWDLFAPASLPLTLLVAYALPRAFSDGAALRAAAWALIATQVMHTTAWIYQNTLPWTWPA